jgi:hypothetical protein
MEIGTLKQKVKDLHSKYGFSRLELAKILIIASTTLIVVSIPAALSFQSAADKAQSVNNQLSETSAVLNSERVQTSLDVLRNTQGSSFEQVSAAIDAVEQSDNSINKTQSLQTNLNQNMKMYQWIVLIGIIGEVAGIAIFFL